MRDDRTETVSKLTQIINDCVQAVDDSELGPLMTVTTNPEDFSDKKKTVSPVAFQVFTQILQSQLK